MIPEEEFLSIISPFSMIKEHLKPAKNIRPWVLSENIHYPNRICSKYLSLKDKNTLGNTMYNA